jgi:peroxiredoxin
MQLTVGMSAPDFILTDKDGGAISLSNLWQSGPTALTFLRHFG